MIKCEDIYCYTDFIFLLINLLTLVIYIMVLFILIKCKETFVSTFYVIFISIGFADIVVVARYAVVTIMKYQFNEYMRSNVLATGFRMIIWYGSRAQYFGVLIMSFNRFTAINHPLKHKLIWTAKTLALTIGLQWTLPILFAAPMLHPCCQSYYPYQNSSSRFIHEEKVERIYYLVDTGYLALISAVIIMVYVLMIEKLVDQRRHPTASSASAKKPEIRLAIIGLILSICLIFMTFRSIIKGFDDDIFDTDFGAFISRLLFSIFNLSNPYMLVISSKPMRTELFNLVTCQKFRKPVEPVKFSQVFATSNSDNNFRAISRHSSHAAERSSIAASAHQRRDSPGSVQMTNNTGSLKS